MLNSEDTSLDSSPSIPDTNSGKFGIEGLYIKEQSCKVPHSPAIYQQQKEGKPEVNLELNIKTYPQQENQFEVILVLHMTMKINQRTACTMEVQQAGLFRLEGFGKTQEAYLLGAYCPGVLFPYARKAICDLALGAGFSATPLPPINFESLYQQRLQEVQAKGESTVKEDGISTPAFNETVTVN